jgi:predicted naringenin-chalcone synthase
MKAPPIIVRTATAVPGHSATQGQVKDRLRALLPLPARKLDAVMELFDHTAVERRYSVEPLSELGSPRGLGAVQRLYRDNAIALGKKVAAEALAGAGLEARDIDLIVTTSCTGIMIPSLDAHLCNELGFRADVRRWRARTISWSGFPRRGRWWWPSSCRA